MGISSYKIPWYCSVCVHATLIGFSNSQVDKMTTQSTKIMVHLALNITYLLSYFFACVTAGANSRVFHGVKDMAGK